MGTLEPEASTGKQQHNNKKVPTLISSTFLQ